MGDVKSALRNYLAQNYTPETVTKVVSVPVLNPLNVSQDTDAKRSAKMALSAFLEEHKQTQVVVVESGADCSDCKDKCSEKIEETVFEFHYKIQKLYDNVHMRTSYFGRNARNDVGASQIDSVAVTLDEYDIFFRLCKEAAADVYTILSANSGDLDKAFVFNAESNGKVTYLISKRKRSFNFNLVVALEILIETAIIYYILAKWFETISMNSEAQKYMIDYGDTVLKIQEKTRNLKMKKTTRRYRFL